MLMQVKNKKLLKIIYIFTNNLRKEILKKVKFRIAGNHMGFGKVIEKKFGLSSISLKKISDVDTSSSIFLKNLK